ncbi:4'-phosphopantetheinyl transferase family protein [Hyunsoonleella sp. 2307UL5-6]|uniref:4'-phosphopantetheinyl transferase family protein n=1 Tax=Hyunsoonleella sp. 2307UL5-6 TaxID=3384768 RepID=UPI0039BD6882
MNYLDTRNYTISDNSIHVWLVTLNTLRNKIQFFKEILSKEELIKASKFRFDKDRQQFIITRGVLRYLSGNYLKINPKDVNLIYSEFGKPYFDMDTTLKFNVSHAEDLAVIGFVNNYDFGIDVEYTKRTFDILDIVDNYFSKHEIKALKKIAKPLQTEAFYRGWTRKEAFVKAKSKGLSFPLDSFSISIETDENAELYETIWDENEKDLWRIIPFQTTKGYKAAFAVKGTISSVKYFKFDLKYL